MLKFEIKRNSKLNAHFLAKILVSSSNTSLKFLKCICLFSNALKNYLCVFLMIIYFCFCLPLLISFMCVYLNTSHLFLLNSIVANEIFRAFMFPLFYLNWNLVIFIGGNMIVLAEITFWWENYNCQVCFDTIEIPSFLERENIVSNFVYLSIFKKIKNKNYYKKN